MRNDVLVAKVDGKLAAIISIGDIAAVARDADGVCHVVLKSGEHILLSNNTDMYKLAADMWVVL